MREGRWWLALCLAVGCGAEAGSPAETDASTSEGTSGGTPSSAGVDASGVTTAPSTSGSSSEETGADSSGTTGDPPPPPLDPDCAPGDDPPPADALYVDPVRGDDGNPGSLEAPMRTLAHAFGTLTPGDTLVLRGGDYFETDLALDVMATADAPVVVRGYPGEQARIDGSLAEFRAPGNAAWEVADASIDLYSSVGTDYGDDIYGGKLPSGGDLYNLTVYTDDDTDGYASLTATTQAVSTGPRYVGPGLYNQGGRLFVRLQPLDAQTLHGRGFDIPADPDPRNEGLFISGESALLNISGSHIQLRDLELAYGRFGVQATSGAHHLRMDRVHVNVPTVGVLLREGVHDVHIDCMDMEGSFPPWVAWTDLKGGDGQSIPAGHWSMRTAGVSGDDLASVEVSRSMFRGVFDGGVMSGDDLHLHHNTYDPVLDDMLQLGSDSSRVELDHNWVVGAGPSHYGRGDAEEPGTKYVHHNVLQSDVALLWGKHDPMGILRPNYSGWLGQVPFPAHTSAEIGMGDPWKIYANTIFYDGGGRSGGCGIAQWTDTNSTGVAHEVYNNVLVETGGGVLIDGMSTQDGYQIYDGNLYHRAVASDAPLWADVDGSEDFATLAEFLASPSFVDSQAMVEGGWESNGVEADPLLDADLAPAADGPAADGAIELPAEFPGERHPHRGALAPAR